MAQLITEAALAAVGTKRPPRTGLVTATEVRKFCVAVDHLDPVFLDEAAARAAGASGILAPPLFPAAATRPVPVHAALLGDGQYDDLAPPGMQHLQSMLAGQEWEFVRPAVVGERLTEEVSIGSVTERSGRSGPLVFVDEISTIMTEAGDMIVKSVNHLVFREPPAKAPPYAGAVPAEVVGEKQSYSSRSGDTLIKRPDMVSVFMFAAAIWGVHRIHWDAEYARSEGLPAPLLPGWMMAAWLCELAQAKAPANRRLASLAVRYRAFAHPGDTLHCTGVAAEDGGMALSIANQSGASIIEGAATFA